MLNQPDRDLIGRYLNNELSGIELENFRIRMDHDVQFKSQVKFQDLLRAGILFSKEEELKKKILEKIKFKKTRIPFALKLIFTFLVVMGIGITLWFYVGTESSNQYKRFVIFPFLSKEKEKKENKKNTESKNRAVHEEDKTSGNEPQEPIFADEKNSSSSAGSAEVQNEKLPASDSTQAVLDEDKDIVIQKDKLLISTSLPVLEKPASETRLADAQNENTTLAKEAAQKLNPGAGIPVEDKVSSNVMVEFWVSPVNYKGYKMSKSKIILFGIEEPDAVRFYRLNDMLYMKYGNDFFRLTNTFDFLSYQRLKETDVPLAIRQ